MFHVRRNFQPMDTNGIDASHPKLIRSGGTSPTKLPQLPTPDRHHADVAVPCTGLNHFGGSVDTEKMIREKIKGRKKAEKMNFVLKTENWRLCRTSKIIYRDCVFVYLYTQCSPSIWGMEDYFIVARNRQALVEIEL